MRESVLLFFVLLTLATSRLAPPSSLHSSPEPVRAGGFKLVEHPSGPMYQLALKSVMRTHPELSKNSLLRVESQVVAGMNFRFTFSDGNGRQRQFTEYVPIDAVSKQPRKGKEMRKGRGLVGKEWFSEKEYQQIRAIPQQLRREMETVVGKYPEMASFQLAEAYSAVDDSSDKKLLFCDFSKKEQALFRVQNMGGTMRVVREYYYHASGYSKEAIEDVRQRVVSSVPVLESYRLVEAWVPGQREGEGRQLALGLEKGAQRVRVYEFIFRGKTWTALYGL